MSTATRIAFVGAGGIAESHLSGLSKHPDVQLAGFCDVNTARAEEVAARYQARAFSDAAEMMDALSPDAIYFCLPPFAHGAELEAVKRGIPFFVEKPVALDTGLAREIAAAVTERNLLTGVGYMNRYRRGVQRVRDLLREDPAILMLGGWIGGSPRGGSGTGSWWVQKDRSGGQFLEQVTHTVDLARFLGGEVVEVHAYAATGFNKGVPENYSIEDASIVNLRFRSGAIANLWASASSNGGGGGVTLSVYAGRTTALFTGWEHTLRLMRAGEDTIEIRGESEIFNLEDQAFIAAVRSQDASRIQCSYPDGVKTLEISVAANRSMETGRPVAVDGVR
jgi:myo-inositol 2-dehydrogenase / D-chiro-inositol 1-dehydrogenase